MTAACAPSSLVVGVRCLSRSSSSSAVESSSPYWSSAAVVVVAVVAAVGWEVQTWEVKGVLSEVSNHYNLLHILRNLRTGSQNLRHPAQKNSVLTSSVPKL